MYDGVVKTIEQAARHAAADRQRLRGAGWEAPERDLAGQLAAPRNEIRQALNSVSSRKVAWVSSSRACTTESAGDEEAACLTWTLDSSG